MLLQLSRALPRLVKTVEELRDAGKFINAPELLGVIGEYKQAAVQHMQEAGCTLPASWQLHDALLACTIFGYLPPIRLACIRSLLHLSYKGPCPHPDCTQEGCTGNRLVIISREPLSMAFKLPHHKNEKAWGQRVISFTLPPEYAELMLSFIGEPHKVGSHLLLCTSHTTAMQKC